MILLYIFILVIIFFSLQMKDVKDLDSWMFHFSEQLNHIVGDNAVLR